MRGYPPAHDLAHAAAKVDEDIASAFAAGAGDQIHEALQTTERGRRFLEESLRPYQREFGWHAVWSHEFIFPTVFEKMEPVVELIRGYIETFGLEDALSRVAHPALRTIELDLTELARG